MNKKNVVITILLFGMFFVPTVFAATNINVVAKELPVVAKDSSDWSIVPNGARGVVKMQFLMPETVYDRYKYLSSLLT